MEARELVKLFAEANRSFTSYTAKVSLETGKEDLFLEAMKEQFVRDAPDSTPRIIGKHLSEKLCEYYSLPEKQCLTAEQLVQLFADADIVLLSKNAKGAISAGRSVEYLEGIIQLHLNSPGKCYELIGAALHLRVYHYTEQV